MSWENAGVKGILFFLLDSLFTELNLKKKKKRRGIREGKRWDRFSEVLKKRGKREKNRKKGRVSSFFCTQLSWDV